MAVITTKFDVGDTVYCAEVATGATRVKCPDCLGTARWKVILPNGEEDAIECPSCKRGYFSEGTICEYAPRGEVVVRTVGQVGYETQGPKYMCHETGVGSGRVYSEADLFATNSEAVTALAAKLDEARKQHAERGLNEYLRNKESSIGKMTAYYRKELREAKKKAEAAQRGLDRIRGITDTE